MEEVRSSETVIRRFSIVATVVLGVAIVGVAYTSERVHRRWSRAVDLLAGPRVRATQLRTGYVAKRENVSDIGGLAGIALDEIALARSRARR